MSEANEPRFLLIAEAAGNCAARYCFENAEYWAMWNLTMTITRSTLTITRAVCRTHREAIEGRHWNEVSENFRRSGVAQVPSEPVLNSRPEKIAVKCASKWGPRSPRREAQRRREYRSQACRRPEGRGHEDMQRPERHQGLLLGPAHGKGCGWEDRDYAGRN
jgi:hypothetical protein